MTTQLYISPAVASFADRDFDLRVSTATVEVEESEFTPLPGFSRKLMILKGELFIEHLNQHAVFLKPFDQDQFLGDWQTKAKGKVIDFNVIYKSAIDPLLSHQSISKGNSSQITTSDFVLMYIFEGCVTIGEETFKSGEIAIISEEKSVELSAIEYSEVILVEIEN
jgi:environmental stress-induced protein Ves